MRSRISLLLFALWSTSHDLAAQAKPASAAKYSKILEVDSTEIVYPSLSPNGRWIAFLGGSAATDNPRLRLIPASGGTLTTLTSGDYFDSAPVWFPKSDRLLFQSSRVGFALMTLSIDPATGRAIGVPQRLTFETAGGAYTASNGNTGDYVVSPDGRWVAYHTAPNHEGERLRIVSANGGTLRTLDSVSVGSGFLVSPAFTTDSRFVEYTRFSTQDSALKIVRVPVDGGIPVVLYVEPRGKEWARASTPPIEGWMPPHVLRPTGNGTFLDVLHGSDSAWLRRLNGDTISRIALPGLFTTAPQHGLRITEKPATLLAVTHRFPMTLEVISSGGGAVRSILNVPSHPGNSLWSTIGLVGVLADGRVAIATMVGNRDVIDLVATGGAGTNQQIVMPDSEHVKAVTRDGRFAYWTWPWGPRPSVLGVFDLSTRISSVITRSFVSFGGRSENDDVLFVERSGDSLKLRAWTPGNPSSRLVRAVRVQTSDARVHFAVRGALAAFSVKDGDSTISYLAASPSGSLQRLFAVKGHPDGISISSDARHIAMGFGQQTTGKPMHIVAFQDLRDDATAAGAPRIVGVDALTGVHWLPNNKEIVASDGMRLSLLANEDRARPRLLAQGTEMRPIDEFRFSKDESWIAFLRPLPTQTSLWRIDLPAFDAATMRAIPKSR